MSKSEIIQTIKDCRGELEAPLSNHMDNIVLNETAQEFYDVINDSCPICGRKFIAPSNIVRLGRVAYDLECYLEATDMGGCNNGK